MDLKIKFEKAKWNKSEYGNDKKVVIVEFPNCISKSTDEEFQWLPTYEQLDKIYQELRKAEKISWGNGE